MGDHPTVGFEVDLGRRVNTYSGAIEDTQDGDSDRSRWMVGAVVCPLCGRRHEHSIARAAGWGWYSAPCDPDPMVGYYLCNTTTTG